ncbi:Uncharacterized transporter HI_0895 [Vibrio chagasii]|nr:Uncharacterized transporter HI_0895 [Vibrio chagasii]
MKSFTDKFIQRPIMAFALSMLIFVAGFQAIFGLQVREYPEMTNTTINITTAYRGAPAEVVQGFISQPIQQVVAEADNIDFVESSSTLGTSKVSVKMRIGADPDAALAEVLSKVNSVKNRLPSEALEPVINRSTGASTATLYLGFSSDTLTSAQIGDYLTRNVQNRLVMVEGLASAPVYAAKLAMRVWIDPDALAKHGISAAQVQAAMVSNNFRAAGGQVKGQNSLFDVDINTDLKEVEEFRRLVVATTDKGVITLDDISEIELGAARESILARFNGDNTAGMAIETTPTANPLDVTARVKEILPSIKENLPADIEMHITYDATEYIEDSINEVARTIFEASLIVILVIFLFMANPRAMVIPVVTIPFSLVGVCLLMQIAGFSINLMTLLAMVLAIGVVVDDAIVVVENVERHIREGKKPFEAAIFGTREIKSPVISTTVVLVAVFLPIGFLGGLTGALFKEFALTLACAVVVSSVVALTLSPVMCSLLLKPAKDSEDVNAVTKGINNFLDNLDRKYTQYLDITLKNSRAVVLFVVFVVAALPALYSYTTTELAPVEDKGGFLVMSNAHNSVNIDYVDDYVSEISKRVLDMDGIKSAFSLSGIPTSTGAFSIMMMDPPSQREATMEDLIGATGEVSSDIAGTNSAVFPFPALPGVGLGFPVQLVVQSNNSYPEMLQVTEGIKEQMDNSGMFMMSRLDISYDAAKVEITVNREKANMYNVTMQNIATTLGILLGDGHSNYINVEGFSYEVIPQVTRDNRLNPELLEQYYVVSETGAKVPLSNLVDIETKGNTQSLIQMNQVNSITISAVPFPNVSLGDAVEYIEGSLLPQLPLGYLYDWKGEVRQMIQEGGALVSAMGLALIVVFLVLAMQFESWRVPLVVMFTVPLAASGALLFQAWGLASMNIYTQIALLTLIGLITKNGILMCEVAQVKQEEGADRLTAIREAARLRLRAILMTAISMVAGVMPLVLASGAGAGARQSLGIVLTSGMAIGTVFTLFVLPTVYVLIAGEAKAPKVIKEEE